MANFFKGSILFMEKYFLQILLMVLVFCLITIYMITHNIHIHKAKHHLVKVATMEAFEKEFRYMYGFCRKVFDAVLY